ncbi:helix-turn-helix domain-containing protein [Thermonema rossianum]|uniref:helix-turn-helix domain-containing protein n=1 Tax=Thermonema rossianum TaxID=55505 RepID=UPI00057209BD|nr:response regulator transcription factor [Thermonema rossianum]
MKTIRRIHTVADFHRLMQLAPPEHPLVSVIKTADSHAHTIEGKFQLNLYMISCKTACEAGIRYGRNAFDFESGSIIFTAPGQVFEITETPPAADASGYDGWTLVFHPDLIRHHPLAQQISGYSFFSYEIYEALHVSEKEKNILFEFVKNIKNEIEQNIDRHSQEIIISNIESILKYSRRFYDRQFYTRAPLHKDILARFEAFLKEYFASEKLANQGLPSIQQCGEALNMSGHYLSDLLKAETGMSAREHIHNYLIEQAKNKLLGSNASISEIAYELGFEYPQHFSKLFKSKTGVSPSEYRRVN